VVVVEVPVSSLEQVISIQVLRVARVVVVLVRPRALTRRVEQA
jgi:hypothetical protein